MKEEKTEKQLSDESVTIPAVRVEEPTPPAEPETVQTPAPNSGAITDHLKSVEFSMLQAVDHHGRAFHQAIKTFEASVADRFDVLTESFDSKHREAVRGIALTVSSEIEQVKLDVRELLSEVRSLARLFNLSKGE